MRTVDRVKILSTKIVSVSVVLVVVAMVFFYMGLWWSQKAHAEQPRVVYPKETKLDLDGMAVDGELKNPGDLYFQYRKEEKFDSLVKRRKNFHREMLRDVVMAR
jgi:hypothetical protein